MAEIKWIKITTNMFDDEKIKLIDAMPERDTIFYIWMRLLVQAGKTNAGGYIFLSEDVPYTDEMLSTIFNRPLNSVRLALDTLKKFGMIQRSENDDLKITNWEKHQNVEGMDKVREQTRKRVAKHRAKKKELEEGKNENEENKNEDNVTEKKDNVNVTLPNGIDIEGEVDIDNTTTTPTTIENVPVDNVHNVDNSDYMEFFNNNFGHLITPFETEVLESYVKDGMEPAAIKLALQEAVEANVRDIRYVKKVLNRWLNNQLKTVKAVIADKKSFKYSRKQKLEKRYDNSSKKSTFNFKGRGYSSQEIKDIEKKLLGWEDG
ncbi:hypothetical protein WX45_01760 [Clostridium ljungdahlii DSM 13528]|uniref:Putative phage replication protein n=1 Tax=Clostridium ljungdahlii (strain ATCC 55383 / DSM 13528 / PETC) TaxID=748727 RepID=D8GQQ4_CLOLD|nr:phage replisome organizer N-terminal domain-containing protein [Clostridium ljungdahlii]ADK16209.1 putative phage replication protein [Clostridium ljungdahlii DSM 13528]OAA89921.1 hypothetical protein WX45_01760 [Clostridium ljungdahlii DSM 13528]